jgi:hypothetical protein
MPLPLNEALSHQESEGNDEDDAEPFVSGDLEGERMEIEAPPNLEDPIIPLSLSSKTISIDKVINPRELRRKALC